MVRRSEVELSAGTARRPAAIVRRGSRGRLAVNVRAGRDEGLTAAAAAESLAQVGHLDLQGVDRVAWLIVGPHQLGQRGGAHHLAGAHDERGQQRSGDAAAHLDRVAVDVYLQRPEDGDASARHDGRQYRDPTGLA